MMGCCSGDSSPHRRIRDDPLFGNSGVQNHVMMMVMMIILSGTDFFKGSFGGIGVQKFVWKTLTGKLDVFHHMIQATKNIIPDPLAMRTVVMDERAWRQFAYWCYAEKHGKAVRNAQKKKQLTFKMLQVHLSQRSSPNERMPDRNTIRRWCRQIMWNVEYWLNGPRYHQDPDTLMATNFPDPFEMLAGESYYGYELNKFDGALRFSERVTTVQREADEVFTQHWMAPPKGQPKKKRLKSTPKDAPTYGDLVELETTAQQLFDK